MPCKWKPDKARSHKRETKQKLKRQQSRKEFAKNMERAEETAQKWYNETYDLSVFKPASALADEFVAWAINRYKHLKFSDPMSQKHKDMHETWKEIAASAEACAKATAARIAAQDKKGHARWMAAEHERREHKRVQRDLR